MPDGRNSLGFKAKGERTLEDRAERRPGPCVAAMPGEGGPKPKKKNDNRPV